MLYTGYTTVQWQVGVLREYAFTKKRIVCGGEYHQNYLYCQTARPLARSLFWTPPSLAGYEALRCRYGHATLACWEDRMRPSIILHY
jgi:hypothetical protein